MKNLTNILKSENRMTPSETAHFLIRQDKRDGRSAVVRSVLTAYQGF